MLFLLAPMAATSSFSKRLGAAVRELALKKGSGGWFGPHMAAAARAIADRIPLVDLVLEVRDARIPLTSSFNPSRVASYSHRHMIVLNKVDLADRAQTESWVKHLERKNLLCRQVNSHNKDSIKELLNAVRARIRELKVGQCNYTATVLLVGIPNVGKSAIANSMHQIGRTAAEEKGKLKHAVVSPRPGETKDISSYKIASHPNIYVLDSPGILFPEIMDDESGCKLALTGAIKDSMVGECELARYFLAVFNSGKYYKQWGTIIKGDVLSLERNDKVLVGSCSDQSGRWQYSMDHTQDFIVKNVRQNLSSTVSSFKGDLEEEVDMKRLIEAQFTALHEAFRLQQGLDEDQSKVVATKLLNLYRIGKLGQYTLDFVPTDRHEAVIS